jgi:hypothetical protein
MPDYQLDAENALKEGFTDSDVGCLDDCLDPAVSETIILKGE